MVIIAMMKCARIVSRDKKSERTSLEHQHFSSLHKQTKKNEFYFVKSPNDNNGLIYVSVSKQKTQ